MAFFAVTRAAAQASAAVPDREAVPTVAPDPVQGLHRALGNRLIADLGTAAVLGTPAPDFGGPFGGVGLHVGPDAGPVTAAPGGPATAPAIPGAAPAGPGAAAPAGPVAAPAGPVAGPVGPVAVPAAPVTGGPAGPAAGAAVAPPEPVRTTDVPYPPAAPQIAPMSAFDAVPLAKLLVGFGVSPATAVALLEKLPLPVDSTAAYWGVPQVGTYIDDLVRGWTARLTALKRPVDPSIRTDLVRDYGETMEGAFGRMSAFGLAAPFSQLPQRIHAALTRKQAEFTAAARKQRLTGTAQDERVVADLITFRRRIDQAISAYLLVAAWGWMVERREHLDFATVPNARVKAVSPFEPAPLPAAGTEAEIVHAELVRRKRELTDRQEKDAVDRATAALRKQRKDPTLELTEDERAAAVAAAEVRQLGGRGEAAKAVTAAGLAEERKDWVDVHEKAPDGTPVWGPRWDKDSIGVLPATAEFVVTLDGTYGSPFVASNYGGHGGGGFLSRGRSLDLTLSAPKQANGFYEPREAIRFLLAINDAASQLGLEWRVLYDDASVAAAVNNQLGRRRVVEIANTTRENGVIKNINWHGPLVLHFHLDLAY